MMRRSVRVGLRHFALLLICFGFAFAQGTKSLHVFSDADRQYPWSPSGYMPNPSGALPTVYVAGDCANGNTCIKLGYDCKRSKWAGIYWIPQGSWDGPGVNVYDLLGTGDDTPMVLTFWAKGEKGGEVVRFGVGGVCDKNDSIEHLVKTKWIRLTPDWTKYEIDLTNEDLSNVVGGFCWITERVKNAGSDKITLFLDEIRYEVR